MEKKELMQLEEVAITEESLMNSNKNFSGIIFKNDMSQEEIQEITNAFRKINKCFFMI